MRKTIALFLSTLSVLSVATTVYAGPKAEFETSADKQKIAEPSRVILAMTLIQLAGYDTRGMKVETEHRDHGQFGSSDVVYASNAKIACGVALTTEMTGETTPMVKCYAK